MKKLFLVGLLFSITPLHSLVVLVHGSFAKKNQWHLPGGDFYEAIKAPAQQHGHNVISFQWSGMPLNKDIETAAKKLAYFINTYPNTEEEMILIGHSHGGNVIMKASQELDQQKKSAMGRCDILITARVRAFMMSNHTTKQSTIHKAYLLGTPIDTKNFMPSMDVIKNICALYSSKDLIQPVMGFYKRKMPNISNCSNLKTWIDNHGPNHAKLHHPTIGQWLLDIPEKLALDHSSGFQMFSWGAHGGINFYSYKRPEYMVMRDLDLPLAIKE